MPIESPTDTATPTAPAATPATPTTPDAGVTNTAATQPGTGTDTAQPNQATDKTFTQADVDRIVQNRLKSAVKAELKKLTGEGDGTPTVEELQRQLSESRNTIRSFEARQKVATHLTDGRNKLNVKAENIPAIQELVIPKLQYDDEGNPTNLKEAIADAQALAPVLFATGQTPPIDAGAGRNASPVGNDMNRLIRLGAGIGN